MQNTKSRSSIKSSCRCGAPQSLCISARKPRRGTDVTIDDYRQQHRNKKAFKQCKPLPRLHLVVRSQHHVNCIALLSIGQWRHLVISMQLFTTSFFHNVKPSEKSLDLYTNQLQITNNSFSSQDLPHTNNYENSSISS